LRSTLSTYDVIVIGAGHAGSEAAFAAARRGARVLVVTPNLDRIGFMPCNPSIGGPAKGHLVEEIDALGGEMGRAADRTALQIRTLNTGKGPAVRALRVQCDKTLYALSMKEALETAPGVTLLQDDATGLVIDGAGEERRIAGIETRTSGRIPAGAVVVTAGTFLRGRLVRGEERHAGGRAGERSDEDLAGGIGTLGIRTRRFKTGTPPRVDARTVDFTAGDLQPGDSADRWFSHDGRRGQVSPLALPPLDLLAEDLPSATQLPGRNQLSCLRVETNPETHRLIGANLDRAPMFNGGIDGTGPRYCPSIEDKVHRFGDKDHHPVFLEPEGWRTTELYVQGLSTSLPADIQDAVLRTIPALRDARITRYGYAVEYDAVDATELSAKLEARRLPGLFLAGQVNGTSGYEEAAAQGLVAGANAAATALGLEPLTLSRSDAYIGVLIDDLTTRSLDEPYRMLTSRAEHRLLLRTDTAPRRLSGIAASIGLLDAGRSAEVRAELAVEDAILDGLRSVWFGQRDTDDQLLARHGIGRSTGRQSAFDLLRRPPVTVDQLDGVLRERGESVLAGAPIEMRERIANLAKYEGFVERAEREADRTRTMDRIRLVDDLDFGSIAGLRIEARQRLSAARPETIGQAGRLAGITPSDVAALLIHHRRTAS
jgi:tRNA uridine 5-carboxymethylaminomethyl modification enzyme